MKNKILILLTFIFCVLALTACDFNKASSVVKEISKKAETTVANKTEAKETEAKKSSTTVTTEEQRLDLNLEAITDEALKKEILAESKNNKSLEEYFTAIETGEIEEVSPLEVQAIIENLLNNINITPTYGELSVTSDSEVSKFAGYLYQEEECVYLSVYQDTEETKQYVMSYYFDIEDLLTNYITEAGITELMANLEEYMYMYQGESDFDKEIIIKSEEEDPEFEGETEYDPFAFLDNLKIDESWFSEDEEVEGLYHLDIEKALMGIFGDTEGQLIYGQYLTIMSGLLQEEPDVYFSYYNGNIRTFGANISILSLGTPVAENEVIAGEFKLNLEGTCHYDGLELSKVEYNLEASGKGTDTVTSSLTDLIPSVTPIELTVSLGGYVDLANYELAVKGQQQITSGTLLDTTNVVAVEDLLISSKGAYGTVTINEKENSGSNDIRLDINLTVNDNLEVSGGFDFNCYTTSKEGESLNGVSFTVEQVEEVPENIYDSLENALCLNDYFYNILNQFITPVVEGVKVTVIYNSYTYDEEGNAELDYSEFEDFIFYQFNEKFFLNMSVDDSFEVLSLDINNLTYYIDDETIQAIEEYFLENYGEIISEYPFILELISSFDGSEEEITEFDPSSLLTCFVQDEEDPTLYVLDVAAVADLVFGESASDYLAMYYYFYEMFKTGEEEPFEIYLVIKDEIITEFGININVNVECARISESMCLVGSVKGNLAIELEYDETQLTKVTSKAIFDKDSKISLCALGYDVDEEENISFYADYEIGYVTLSSNYQEVIDLVNYSITIPESQVLIDCDLPMIKATIEFSTEGIYAGIDCIEGEFNLTCNVLTPEYIIDEEIKEELGEEEIFDEEEIGEENYEEKGELVFTPVIELDAKVSFSFGFDESGNYAGYLSVDDENYDVNILTIKLETGYTLTKDDLMLANYATPLDEIIINAINEILYSQSSGETIYFESFEDFGVQLVDLGYEYEASYDEIEEKGIKQQLKGTYEDENGSYVVALIEFDDDESAYDFFTEITENPEEDLCYGVQDNFVFYYTYGGPIEDIFVCYEIQEWGGEEEFEGIDD